MSKQDGGSAFPVVGMDQRNGQSFLGVFQNGMTLRDYFAAKALVALFSASAHPQHNGIPASYYPDTATEAYKIADAMLIERTRTAGKDTDEKGEGK